MTKHCKNCRGQWYMRKLDCPCPCHVEVRIARSAEVERAEREQARAEHLGELAEERAMVQAQTPVVNVEEDGA